MPVSPFPMEFAQAILSLKQQREQQDAQLAEMRRARDLQEQTQRTRTEALERSTALQEQQFGFEVEKFKATMAAREKAIELETADKLKREEQGREAMRIKGLQDFADKGSAFIPTEGFAEFATVRKSLLEAGEYVSEIPIPGMGIIATRMTGELADQHRKISAEIDKINADTELARARKTAAIAKIQFDSQRLENLVGNVSNREGEAASNILDTYRRGAARTADLLRQSEADSDLERAAAIDRNWVDAYPEGSQERKIIDDGNVVLASLLETKRRNLTTPATSNSRLLDLADVSRTLNSASAGTLPLPDVSPVPVVGAPVPAPAQAPPVKAVGRITTARGRHPSEMIYVLADGTQVTTDDAARYIELGRKVKAGELSSDDPRVQEARAILEAIAAYNRTYAYPSWLNNE